ncbi:hypothetical protein C4J81_18185 [Deltaproteobacteria bacterium Smac51]|nr:hypothetical protein C4J81_18185 [Deltaproteobacteria bacterium Smac51]
METPADVSPRAVRTPQQRWLMGLRLITSTFILVSLFLLRYHGSANALSLRWFESGLTVIGIYILLAVLHYRYPVYPGGRVAGQGLQIVSDLALAICITLISGGAESPFNFLFLIAIINSSFMGGIRLALTVATFSAALWGMIISIQSINLLDDWFSFPAVYEKVEFSGRQVVNILINTGACYLVAVLSGHLAGQIIQSRRDLVQSQATLDRLSDLNESIVKSIDSGLITTDTHGLILSVNPAGLGILGLGFDEVYGRPWQMFLPQLEHILPLSARSRFTFRDSVSGLRFEYLRAKDNVELVLELDVMALMDKDNEIWGRLLVLKDFTSLNRMETEVKKAEHLAALGEMAAGLAHEVRTPLASMSGAITMLQGNSYSPEDQERLMAIIGREMERLTNLSNDFLSFARPSPPVPQAFDLNETISEQLRVFECSLPEGRSLITNLQPLPNVYFDRDKFIQILWNLLSNALEAGEKNYTLHITIETGPDPDRPGQALMKINDNGPGISSEIIVKIFEPFFSTKARGGGLGLPTVSRLLHEGGGNITVTSTYQNGTTFTVFLPLV